MPISAAAAALGAAGISAAGGLLGTAASNQASAKQAKINREFQERMSNTAFQRAADDLEAAGLNRILALGSPASTPGGAQGQVYNYGSPIEAGVNAGIGAYSSAQQGAVSEATVGKIIQETSVLSEREKSIAVQSELWQAMKPAIQALGATVEKSSAGYMEILDLVTGQGMINKIANLMSAADEKSTAAMKAMGDYFNTSVQELKDLARRYQEGENYLGSGGPQ